MPNKVTQSQLTLTSTVETEKFRNPSWWRQRNPLERVLCSVTTISLIIFFAMTVALAVVTYKYQRNLADRLNKKQEGKDFLTSEHVCTTPGCVITAATVLRNIDDSVNPCEDFYHFACGGWIKEQVIPEDKSDLSAFSLLRDDLKKKLRALVEQPITGKEPEFIFKVKNMYNTCMDLSKYTYSFPVRRAITTMLLTPLSNTQHVLLIFDWLETLIKFRRHGYSNDILVDLSVITDYRNNSEHIIELDQTALGMPDRSYLIKGLSDPGVAAYYKLMINSAVLLGASQEDAEEQMLKALNFEITLANISLPREERRNLSKLYNKMNVTDISRLAPQINWRKFLNNLLVDPIPDSEPVVVIVPEFIKKIGEIVSSSDKRVISNYMLWRVVLRSFHTLSKPWRELIQQYNTIITGKTIEPPRWEQCMDFLTNDLGVALASLYVRNHFQEESKQLALEIVNYIHKEFVKMLDELHWMDEKTKQKAKEKAHAIQSHIGYPDELLDEDKLTELYENLTVTSDNYFENVQNTRLWTTDYEYGRLREPNKKGNWKKYARAADVNAYYSSMENSIQFPAGILQGVFFGKDRPNYMNYGGIGFVIGHEITHGFDDRGRQFNKDGNNENWWEPQTDQLFREKAQCIIEQYGNYTVPENGLKINGINTQGENIADNGGLKQAYRAYKSWVKDNGPELPLIGLKYSPEQLFWISAANVWCGKYRPEVLKLRILSGWHSPAQFRIIGSFSNLEDFAKSFNCSINSHMNPQKKCTIW
ncbi:membrane metallo-endopeptidase-like 1 [Limulus polyphemus]|uniref:Membrane metallo-endopeptidase-like 1 n=1 Tax=Limulus polyphemus TaxID=6850 RepID=A0ABM1AZR5_LIMPO|nr:membrane metallo-endopeptidase-like 1 [Limulus polyphemus]